MFEKYKEKIENAPHKRRGRMGAAFSFLTVLLCIILIFSLSINSFAASSSYSFNVLTQGFFFYNGSTPQGSTLLDSTTVGADGSLFTFHATLGGGNYYPANNNYRWDFSFACSPLSNSYITVSWFTNGVNSSNYNMQLFVSNPSISGWAECNRVAYNATNTNNGATASFKLPAGEFTKVLVRVPFYSAGTIDYPEITFTFNSVTSVPVDISGDISNSTNDIMNNDNNNTNKIIDGQYAAAQQQMQNENSNTDKQIQEDKKNAQSIIDNQNSLAQQEKNETQQSGNNAVDGAENIPDKSQGFISALGGLVTSLSYNGTECAWKLPKITIPAIPNVIGETVLSEEKDINFAYWVEKIPSNILTLVRNLFTIAIVVYCFKELYDTISYVLTLKGGNAND